MAGEDPIVLAKLAFDETFDEAGGPAGPVIGRFAPPVAALPDARLPMRRDGPLGVSWRSPLRSLGSSFGASHATGGGSHCDRCR